MRKSCQLVLKHPVWSVRRDMIVILSISNFIHHSHSMKLTSLYCSIGASNSCCLEAVAAMVEEYYSDCSLLQLCTHIVRLSSGATEGFARSKTCLVTQLVMEVRTCKWRLETVCLFDIAREMKWMAPKIRSYYA